MKTFILICMICMVMVLSACGRMSAVQKPSDAVYPDTYTVKL
jgi:uncharacterized protein YceK